MFQGPRLSKGESNSRRASQARPCSYVDLDSSQVFGFAGSRVLKGKSAIQIARVYLGKRKNFVGQHFWVRGYFVSTVGMNEETIRAYIKAQEKEDRRLDQMNLFPE